MKHGKTESVAPGVWRIRFGETEEITPVTQRKSRPCLDALAELPETNLCPVSEDLCHMRLTARGCMLTLPYQSDEGIYGFGLQLKSHLQSGKKKHLRVNSDPVSDTGDSHAPVPFYTSTKGYGVLVDTARYASVYVGTHASRESLRQRVQTKNEEPKLNTTELYTRQAIGDSVVIDIPAARGVDIYVFGGPEMRDAVSRYNLFSGGGCLPPLWGLGNWYRACARQDATEVQNLVDGFQADQLPFSVIGLEPGWQTQTYPCSYVWSEKFPDPAAFATQLKTSGYRLNLWEHAFVHPTAPFADEITPYCGENLGMDGLVPDFLTKEASGIFSNYHEKFLQQGVSGFKLDECDNSDFISFSWSFPEHDRFPSGADGEQMHCLMGTHYQQVIEDIYHRHGQRYYGSVRSAGALAAPHCGVLYSDLYDHRDFIRGVVNSGFCGLLWSSEVRHATSIEDLVRRIQTTVLTAQSQINAWYIPLPPWAQINRQLNGEGIVMPEAAEVLPLVKAALDLRVQLMPLLYTAFAEYARSGKPPIRAVVMDYPNDKNTWNLDQQFLIGDNLLAAPLVAGETQKEIYLPEGTWWEFATGIRVNGGQTITLENPDLNCIPLYVKDGAIIPLATLTGNEHGSGAPMHIQPHIFADDHATGTLYEDDGESLPKKTLPGIWHQISWSPESGFQMESPTDTPTPTPHYTFVDAVLRTTS